MIYFDASFGIAISAPLGAPASVEDGSITQSGHLDGVDSIFDCPEGRFFYDSGTLPHNTAGFEPEGGSASTFPHAEKPLTSVISSEVSQQQMSHHRLPLPPRLYSPTTAHTLMVLICSCHPTGLGLFCLTHTMYVSISRLSRLLLTESKALTNAGSVPSPPRDDTEDHINNPHAHEALTSNLVLLSDLLSDFGTLETPQAEQVPRAPPNWDGINFAPLTQQDDALTSTQVGLFENIPPLPWLNYTDNTVAPVNLLTTTTTTGSIEKAGTVLGKRAREWYGISRKAPPQANDNDSGSSGITHKRRRPSASWVLEEAEGSTKGTRHAPGTSAQKQDEKYTYDSTTQSREARTITAQELYLHPLLGSSIPQETVGFPEQEQLEGREQSEIQRDLRSVVSQRTGGSAEDRESLYEIPSALTERQRLMLQTTEDDVERRAVRVIKCKLCPTVELGSWQCFRRHCKTSEDHPAELTFCNRCGDHFGRRDSEKRHTGKKYQEECRTTPRDQAEWKKKTVKRLFEEFNAKVERCLRTGEELGPRFAAITQQAMQQAKVPTTSKKQKKIRLEGNP